MAIQQEYYRELEIELKSKYSRFMGIDADDRSLNIFTEDEQIKRYAKNLAFWTKERLAFPPGVIPREDGKALAKFFLVSQYKLHVEKTIERNFDKCIQDKIHKKCLEIISN